jgi:hypothetical protein
MTAVRSSQFRLIDGRGKSIYNCNIVWSFLLLKETLHDDGFKCAIDSMRLDRSGGIAFPKCGGRKTMKPTYRLNYAEKFFGRSIASNRPLSPPLREPSKIHLASCDW